MFLFFLVVLISGAATTVAVFSSGEMIGMSGLVTLGHQRVPQRMVLVVLRSYIWFGWAAYSAWFALRFASEPGVTNPWVYCVAAIAASGVPVAYLHGRDDRVATSDEERTQLRNELNRWQMLLLCGCALFLIVPPLMDLPYGWVRHADRMVFGNTAHGPTKALHAAQEQIVPSTDYRQPIQPGSGNRGDVGAPTMVVPRRSTSEAGPAYGPDALCEPSDERTLETKKRTPCVDSAQSELKAHEGE